MSWRACILCLLLPPLAPAQPVGDDPERLALNSIDLVRAGRNQEARTTLEQALRIARQDPRRPALLAAILSNLGAAAKLNHAEVLARAQQFSEARTALDEAMAIAAQTLAAQPAVMARFFEHHAFLLTLAGDKPGAKTAAKQARRWSDRSGVAAPGRHTVELSDLLARGQR